MTSMRFMSWRTTTVDTPIPNKKRLSCDLTESPAMMLKVLACKSAVHDGWEVIPRDLSLGRIVYTAPKFSPLQHSAAIR